MNQCRILIIDQKLVKGNMVSWNEAGYSVYAVRLTSSGNVEGVSKIDDIKNSSRAATDLRASNTIKT